MFRKLTLGLIAAASLTAAAMSPASAHGWGWHGGWHGGWYGFGYPGLYVSGLTDSCYQQRVIETRHGPRVRVVNVCAY
jgi:hypothetical protein